MEGEQQQSETKFLGTTSYEDKEGLTFQTLECPISECSSPSLSSSDFSQSMTLYETAAIIVGQILDKAFDCIFKKTISTRCSEKSLAVRLNPEGNMFSQENGHISNSITQNNNDKLMECFVSSTSKADTKTTAVAKRKSYLDFSMLRNTLNNGDYFPPYLPNTVTMKRVITGDICRTTYLPVHINEKAVSTSQIGYDSFISDTLCHILRTDITSTFCGQSNICSVTAKQSAYCYDELDDISSFGKEHNSSLKKASNLSQNILLYSIPAKSNIDNFVQYETGNLKPKLNKNKSITSSSTEIEMRSNPNLIANLSLESSRIVSLLVKNAKDTPQLKCIYNDQIVPIAVTHGSLQSMYETSRECTIKTAALTTKTYRDTSLQQNLPMSCESIKPRTLNRVLSWNNSSLSNLDEITICSFDSKQPFTIENTLIRNYFEFNNSNVFTLPLKLKVMEGSNPKYGYRCDKAIDHTSVPNASSTVSKSLCRNILITSQRNIGSNCDEGFKTSNNPIDFNNSYLYNTSNSSESNILMQNKYVNVHKIPFDGIHKCKVLSESPLLINIDNGNKIEDVDELDNDNKCGAGDVDELHNGSKSESGHLDELDDDTKYEAGDVDESGNDNKCEAGVGDLDNGNKFEDGNVDELDQIIHDSMKKYENFMVEVGVSAVPYTAEKSSQTEMMETDTARCKRCLGLDEYQSEPAKKAKVDFIENPGFKSKATTTNDCNIDSNHSLAYSTGEDVHDILNKNYSNHNITNNNNSSMEGVQLSNFYSPVNNKDQTTIGSLKNLLHRTVEVDGWEEGERSFFDEEKVNLSNEILHESEQEVPANAHANEGHPFPFPFVIPKKPVLRVGLSRSARFRPLHPRI